MMSLAVDDRIPRVEGEVNEYGSLMMVFIKAEGRASLCMVALNELLLRRQYERREGNGWLKMAHMIVDLTARVRVPPRSRINYKRSSSSRDGE